MKYYQTVPANQLLFEKNFGGLTLILLFFGRIVKRVPLLIAGYMITNYILVDHHNFFKLALMTIVFSYFIYLFIYFMKGLLIGLKSNKSFWWIVLFLSLITFVCVLPVFAMLQLEFSVVNATRENQFMVIVIMLAYSVYTFNSYCFLTNVAPRSVYPIYRAGIWLSSRLLRFTVPTGITKFIFGQRKRW